LKARIVEKFGTQSDFSQAIKTDEAIISKIVRNRRQLTTDQKLEWANKLGCDPKEIFPE
jgi:plasmid maintenance system antidote protein VapI